MGRLGKGTPRFMGGIYTLLGGPLILYDVNSFPDVLHRAVDGSLALRKSLLPVG